MLIDARHGLKDADAAVLKTLDEAAVSYQIVLTKADQVKKSELEKRVADTAAALAKRPAAFPEILADLVARGRRHAGAARRDRAGGEGAGVAHVLRFTLPWRGRVGEHERSAVRAGVEY